MLFHRQVRFVAASIAFTLLGLASPSWAHGSGDAVDTRAASAATGVAEVFNQQISNIPGKSMIAVQVDYAPGEKSPAHWHENSSFIMAYVVSGAIRSQVAGEPVKVFQTGQSWFENPGAHHLISENASDTAPARLLAVFVVDSQHGDLTRFDRPEK